MTNRQQRPSAYDESLTKELAHAAAEKAHEGAAIAAEKARDGAVVAAEKTQVAAHAVQAKAAETAGLTADGLRADRDTLDVRKDKSNPLMSAFRKIFGVYDIHRRASLYTLPSGEREAGYTRVMTLNGTSMLRPQKIRGILLLPFILCIIAAIIIGALIFNNIYVNVLSADKKEMREVTEILATPAAVQIPAPQTLVGFDDATIAATQMAADSQTYQATATSGDVSLLLYHIPSAVSVAIAQTEIEKGIAKLDAVEAAKLLNGFWELAVSRDPDATTIAMRYADFVQTDCAGAITSCMAQQGLAEDSVTESGVDDIGNTYKTGTAVVNDIATTWRISSVPLSDIYSVRNLPTTASYVVLKYTY